MIDQRLQSLADQQPYPLVFATISGAHLYGFPSPDSDFDLRGVHVLPLDEVIGLHAGRETIESDGVQEGLEMDIVTHDVKKFFTLLLKNNGYVFEQLLSPLVVRSSAEHQELLALAPKCLTKFHAFHYLGFAETQWRLFEKEPIKRVKPLLYVYRVLLTGIHLMRTAEIEPNLVRLNEVYKLSQIQPLIDLKLSTQEHATIGDSDLGFHRSEYARLRSDLETAQATTSLPERPSAKDALHDLLMRIRRDGLHATAG